MTKLSYKGEYDSKLDDKGRLVFPAALRAQAGALYEANYIIRKDIHQKCLVIYSIADWASLSESIRKKLTLNQQKDIDFWREFNRSVYEISSDEKTGRITIPKKLLEDAGIEKDVTFVGAGRLINVWAKNEYDAVKLPPQDLSALARELNINLNFED